jgi:hypothetical protein
MEVFEKEVENLAVAGRFWPWPVGDTLATRRL